VPERRLRLSGADLVGSLVSASSRPTPPRSRERHRAAGDNGPHPRRADGVRAASPEGPSNARRLDAARAPGQNASSPASAHTHRSRSGTQVMMRGLLADRFKLAVHHETRDLPVYALVLARSDGRLGPQLRATTVDCAALAAARGRGNAPSAGPPRPTCGMSGGSGNLIAGSATLRNWRTRCRIS
jgi:hypothetical protein